MVLQVTSGTIATLLAESARAMPDEACGLLLGRAGRIGEALLAANVHPEPLRHFEIDPVVLIAAHRAARKGGPEVIGYWHSHPTGDSRPSATDRALASGDGRVWAIVGRGEVSFWRDGASGFAALSTCRIEG